MVTITEPFDSVCDIRNPFSFDSVSNVFTGSFAPDGTLAPRVVPEPRVIPHSQAIPDSSLGCPCSTGHLHAFLGPEPNHLTFPTHSTPTSLSSTEVPALVSNEGQLPLVLYRTPESSGRRCCQRSAINIEDLWIDKDDLYSATRQGSSTISVHKCQWAKSSKPCEMWIIGSRARVGAHVRKWHEHAHAGSGAQCLWDGCTAKAMLKDSIGRHVVTVHLGEGFRCKGCDQEFSRKDVYDQHVRKGELCRDAGAATVYSTECRVIDTRKALQRGGPVRYAGQ
ncbi:hypothetical protein J3R83DRAFT_2418 [Lanmaoa asiatica]|nr:hypothetical protein J3R83DRAFT_2418 [Lanmaoa asiatica]